MLSTRRSIAVLPPQSMRCKLYELLLDYAAYADVILPKYGPNYDADFVFEYDSNYTKCA